MKVTFLSNYINHHQIPFCDAMYARLKEDFVFLQAMPMEEERRRMGWAVEEGTLPYVRIVYEDEEAAKKLLCKSDAVLLGWSERFDLETLRLKTGKLTLRVSERIYREGRWKRFSPRGLLQKYKEHYRYRNADVCLLCAGAYVSGDFSLIGCYKEKMYRFGYFPPFVSYDTETIQRKKTHADKKVRLLFAGRMLKLKHPEVALRTALRCKEEGLAFHLDLIGDGPLLQEMKDFAAAHNLSSEVTFHGALSPERVRAFMEEADIFLFPSNHLEGWGAVVNEAMNSACCVVACDMAGSVPYLLRDKENGCVVPDGNFTDFANRVQYCMLHEEERLRMGLAAYETIRSSWNAETAADAVVTFIDTFLKEGEMRALPGTGPMSAAPVL